MTTASGHTSAIRAKKVLGTAVKDSSGKKLGHVEDIVLDKQTNDIMFAVVSFGGFLGMAEKFHPLPWASLDYDEGESSYIVNVTEDQLRAAPADSLDELTRNDGTVYRDRINTYYKIERH